MKVTTASVAALVFGVIAAFGARAHAQAVDNGGVAAGSNFARNRNESVRDRPRPGFEAIGIPMGGFNLFPRLTADAQYNSNIYATQTGVISDTIFHITPEVAMRSNWTRHQLALYARANFNEYASHSTESTQDYSVGASGRLDLLRTSNLFGGTSFDHATEPRTAPTSPAASVSPIQYNLFQGNFGGVHEMNRIRLSGRVNYFNYNYFNNHTANGDVLLQDDRDRDEWYETGRVEYALTPDKAIYVEAVGNQRNYRLHPPQAQFNRDSTGYTVSAGTNFDITRLIRGEAQIGYMSQSYSDPRFGNNTTGLAYNVAIDWFPTPLTTVNVSGGRSIQEAVANTASGYVSTNIGARIDHELRRNILFSAHANYDQDNYHDADRIDKRTLAGVSGTYLMNAHIGLRLTYDFQSQRSSGTAHANSYDDHRITGGLTFQY
jgi:hypothetical protein